MMIRTNRTTARRSWRILNSAPAMPQQPQQADSIQAAPPPGADVVWQGRPPFPVHLNQLPQHPPDASSPFND